MEPAGRDVITTAERALYYLSAAWSGFLALAVELSLARLLRPWFGDMLFVWAAIIGFVLLYLALGNYRGGRVRKRPPQDQLMSAFEGAGLGIALLPLLSRYLLPLAQQGMRAYHLTPPLVAMIVIWILLASPLTSLGMVPPLVVRLLAATLEEIGDVTGRVLAVGTFASLLGAFLPVFVLLPTLGTYVTFGALGLLALAWATLLRARYGERHRVIFNLLLILGLALSFWAGHQRPVKGRDPSGRGRVLYEGESPYNFIQVSEVDGERWLRLNEGEGLHSVWRPEDGLSAGIWDYFLLAPCFTLHPEQHPQDLLVIGLAGGTVPTLYKHAFGNIPMVGVELDSQVVQVAYRYFGLTEIPTLQPWIGDGRLYLTLHDRQFDVIAVDAYRPPYIPFHLTTWEFFRLVKAHLREEGVVAVNVARTQTDHRLVDGIAATMNHVFPAVFVLDEPLDGAAWGNALVVGTTTPMTEQQVRERLAGTPNPYVRAVGREAMPHLRRFTRREPLWTDDHAPVEQVVHSIIWAFLTGRDR